MKALLNLVLLVINPMAYLLLFMLYWAFNVYLKVGFTVFCFVTFIAIMFPSLGVALFALYVIRKGLSVL